MSNTTVHENHPFSKVSKFPLSHVIMLNLQLQQITQFLINGPASHLLGWVQDCNYSIQSYPTLKYHITCSSLLYY